MSQWCIDWAKIQRLGRPNRCYQRWCECFSNRGRIDKINKTPKSKEFVKWPRYQDQVSWVLQRSWPHHRRLLLAKRVDNWLAQEEDLRKFVADCQRPTMPERGYVDNRPTAQRSKPSMEVLDQEDVQRCQETCLGSKWVRRGRSL